MANYNFSLGIADTHALITINIKDQDGAIVNLSAGVTDVDVLVVFGKKWRKTKTMQIIDAVNGVCTVQFNAGMLKEGINSIHAIVNWATGKESYTVTDYKINGLRL